MFGIGSTEILVILVVALIVLGPKKLAGFSRSLGKMVGEFRRVSTDFQRTLNFEAAQEELKTRKKESSVTSPYESSNHTETRAPDSTQLGQAINKARKEAEKANSTIVTQSVTKPADKKDGQ